MEKKCKYNKFTLKWKLGFSCAKGCCKSCSAVGRLFGSL